LLFICCDVKNPVSSIQTDYIGTWNWFKTVGGFFPTIRTPEDGRTITIHFTKRNIFSLYFGDTLKVVARYKIEPAEHDQDKITYSNITEYDYHFENNPVFARISLDTLRIWDGQMDGFFSYYTKE